MNKQNKLLVGYLKETIEWLKEKNPTTDNEIVLLQLIRELQQEDPINLAILRERLLHIAGITEKEAKPKWTNPFIHWTKYKTWGTKVQTLLSFENDKVQKTT